ncbi:MAG TPA: methyltransferase [Vicinamibacterales bacterium]|nr:methyltransferase [Vicinamibacterales bacterium]
MIVMKPASTTRSVLGTIAVSIVLHAAFTVGVPLALFRLTSGWRGVSIDLGNWRWLGAPTVAAGAWCYAWSLCRLLRIRTSALPGLTPLALETKGLYAYVRHPLLLGVVLILVGEAVIAQSLALAMYAASYWLALDRFVAMSEERDLHRVFSDRYAQYCRDVPRWLPRLRRPRGGSSKAF